jgi:phosphoglycolate phosphatase
MRTRAVIFDFDLTLADSTAPIVECANHALVAMGLQAGDAEQVRRTIGLPLPEVFRALTGRSDATLEGEFSRRFVARADEVMVAGTQVYPEVPSALTALRLHGVRLAIVSTKFRYRIEQILTKSGLANCIDVIVGGEDVRQHKPHPEGLLCAMAQLGVHASRTLYVGDHPVDAEAARAAGAGFVAVRTGVSPPKVWETFPAIAVLDSLGGLIGLVRRLERSAQ